MSLVLGLSVAEPVHVGKKEVSQERLHPITLAVLSSRDQCWIQVQVQNSRRVVVSGACLGSVETFDGTGQPDEPLQALDVSTAVVQQLVFRDRSAAVRREKKKQEVYLFVT